MGLVPPAIGASEICPPDLTSVPVPQCQKSSLPLARSNINSSPILKQGHLPDSGSAQYFFCSSVLSILSITVTLNLCCRHHQYLLLINYSHTVNSIHCAQQSLIPKKQN